MDDCIFCKIARHEIKSTLFFENDHVVAIQDIHPVAPVHILVIPKKHIEEFYSIGDNNDMLIAVKDALHELIEKNELHEKGYKIEVNGGGAQLVNHLHFHLIGPVRAPVAK